MMRKDVIIIGGGAAGLFCAIAAGRRGRSVLLIEHAEKVGKKILISGGGRCNFTNLYTAPENFICSNPNFHKSALARFSPQDFIELVEKHRIKYHEKKLGQLFCDGSSQEIMRMLLKECAAAGVEIRVSCKIESVDKNQFFTLTTNQGRFECQSLVVATGGLSIPKMGATDFGYRLAKQFGLRVIATKPALVPFTRAEPDRQVFNPLSGVSIDAQVSLGEHSFRENILFTHQGLSGPAILQISSYWNPGESIQIDLMPDLRVEELLKEERESLKEIQTLLSRYWPSRFAQVWAEVYAPAKPIRQYSNQDLRAVSENIHCWRIKPEETEGYRKAEVTAGGVDTDELSSKTMEARKAPGLYFIGEVVDVTGQLGGFNFQWAWASGYATGQAV
jgi:predicted Rossmann fold flavoprotein